MQFSIFTLQLRVPQSIVFKFKVLEKKLSEHCFNLSDLISAVGVIGIHSLLRAIYMPEKDFLLVVEAVVTIWGYVYILVLSHLCCYCLFAYGLVYYLQDYCKFIAFWSWYEEWSSSTFYSHYI